MLRHPRYIGDWSEHATQLILRRSLRPAPCGSPCPPASRLWPPVSVHVSVTPKELSGHYDFALLSLKVREWVRYPQQKNHKCPTMMDLRNPDITTCRRACRSGRNKAVFRRPRPTVSQSLVYIPLPVFPEGPIGQPPGVWMEHRVATISTLFGPPTPQVPSVFSWTDVLPHRP